MTSRQLKTSCFALEAFNAFATGFYFNWLFFFTQNRLHFGVAENLGLVAVHGIIYTGAAWFGGWFSHRFGRFAALKTGFAIMALGLGAGTFLTLSGGQIAVLLLWTFGACFTWPSLQSLVSDGEPAHRMPRMAGIYNVVWSAMSAISYFIGGTLLEKLGVTCLFWIPAIIHALQFVAVLWLERQKITPSVVTESKTSAQIEPAHSANPLEQKLFLKLALIANPLAYVAINTAIPMIPEVAKRFQLSPMWIGFLCSIWFFMRMGAFILFWLWPGWHYRFSWLVTACAMLVISFLGLLISTQLWILVVAQIAFGLAVGLIYYSSLFYSMDGGASKSEHGGAHEAMIGFGTFLGAAVGVAAKYAYPNVQGISTWAVSLLLLLGLIALIWLRLKNKASHT